MGIESINIDKALVSETYAAQCIRSGKLSGDQRLQIVSKWGADKVKLWESVDSTQYKIDDDSWDEAKSNGRKKAEEGTGHDGSKESILKVGSDVLMAGASAVGAIAPKLAGKAAEGAVSGFSKAVGYNPNTLNGNTVGQEMSSNIGDRASVKDGTKNLGARATVIMAAAVAAKYWLQKPNKDQYEAAMKLYDAKEGSGGLLLDGQYSLEDAQAIMEEATEETTALTEESQEINDEANDKIEDDKTNFDFFRKQYEFIKAKAQSGEQLTPDEKQLIQKLAPLMEEAKANITETQEGASNDLNANYEEIQGFEGQYDIGAETIAEVQGLTDFAEGFDSATRTMAYVEGVSQGINAISAGRAAAILSVSGFWNIAFAAIGYAAAAGSSLAASQQIQWAGQVGQEIDVREATQDLGDETQDVYDTELDNFAGNMDIIDDMELAIPEDLEVPDAAVPTGDPSEGDIDPLAAGAAGVGEGDGDGDGNGNGGLENDENYTNVMGKGSDYTDILTGKVKRGDNDKLVTNADGKVILTSTYANAIVSVTGDQNGEGYDKEFIPEIIAKVLGDPFTVDVINNVRNGGSVDSEFAAKLVKTKSGQNAGDTTVDNTAAATQKAKSVIDFYWPIFDKAASGWVRG